MKKTYDIEITDLFGGEANYSYVDRFSLSAKNERGAIQIVSRKTGLNFRKAFTCGESTRYDSKSRLTCVFLAEKE